MNGIKRIEQAFLQHKKLLVGYLMAGDEGVEKTLASALALIEGGVNLLEIGVPFSDPVADGPVIQRAGERSLASGTTMKDVLKLVKSLREKTDVPLILFSYLNPILSALKSFDFLAELKSSGLDGVLIVDGPMEELSDFYEEVRNTGLAPIYIISPSTPKERIQTIDGLAEGFLYYACRKGVTGVKNQLPADFKEKMQGIKSIVSHPVVAGFGISNGQMVKEVFEHADGVVMGSFFVKAVEEGKSSDELISMVKKIKLECV